MAVVLTLKVSQGQEPLAVQRTNRYKSVLKWQGQLDMLTVEAALPSKIKRQQVVSNTAFTLL